MIKRFLPVVAAAAAFSMPASAATTISIVANPNPCVGLSCSFRVDGLTTDAIFSGSQTFNIPSLGKLAGSLINIEIDATTNVDFSDVRIIGPDATPYVFTLNNDGLLSTAILSTMVTTGGKYTLQVAGTSGGNGAFGGNLAFRAPAVPEASTWALMILGFGVVGGALRRSKARPALRYA